MASKAKGTRWSIDDVNAYNAKRGNAPVEKQKPNKRMPKIEKVSVEKRSIEMVLFALHRDGVIPEYHAEVRFDLFRKWRFDWAVPDLKLAIEYEGLMSEKSGHTTPTGYTSDCEKYNQAQLNGWTVFRYTALNYADLHKDLMSLVNLPRFIAAGFDKCQHENSEFMVRVKGMDPNWRFCQDCRSPFLKSKS